MANQFKPIIDQLKDQSDKDGSKDLLYQEYKKYTAAMGTVNMTGMMGNNAATPALFASGYY